MYLNFYVIVEKYPFREDRSTKETQMTTLRWNRLVNKLYTELYLHEWKKSYNDWNICDREQWELIIKLSGNRKRTYHGSNAFPPYWPELKALFRPLIALSSIEEKWKEEKASEEGRRKTLISHKGKEFLPATWNILFLKPTLEVYTKGWSFSYFL